VSEIPDGRVVDGFAGECRRQSRLAAEADAADPELAAFLDGALADLAAPAGGSDDVAEHS